MVPFLQDGDILINCRLHQSNFWFLVSLKMIIRAKWWDVFCSEPSSKYTIGVKTIFSNDSDHGNEIIHVILQILHINLNNMVCPAVSDPFSGPYYRIIACCHQPLLIFLIGKIFCIFGHQFVKALYGTEGKKKEWLFSDDIHNCVYLLFI